MMAKATNVAAFLSMNFFWQVVHAGIYEDYSRLLMVSENETNTTLAGPMKKPRKDMDMIKDKVAACAGLRRALREPQAMGRGIDETCIAFEKYGDAVQAVERVKMIERAGMAEMKEGQEGADPHELEALRKEREEKAAAEAKESGTETKETEGDGRRMDGHLKDEMKEKGAEAAEAAKDLAGEMREMRPADYAMLAKDGWTELCGTAPPTVDLAMVYRRCDNFTGGALSKGMAAFMDKLDDMDAERKRNGTAGDKKNASDMDKDSTTTAEAAAPALAESSAFSNHLSVVSVAITCVAMVLAKMS